MDGSLGRHSRGVEKYLRLLNARKHLLIQSNCYPFCYSSGWGGHLSTVLSYLGHLINLSLWFTGSHIPLDFSFNCPLEGTLLLLNVYIKLGNLCLKFDNFGFKLFNCDLPFFDLLVKIIPISWKLFELHLKFSNDISTLLYLDLTINNPFNFNLNYSFLWLQLFFQLVYQN